MLEAFNLCRQGHGLRAIATSLNERGLLRRGQRWTTSGLSQLLNSEIYIGWSVFNKRDTKTEGRRYKPRSEWIIVKDTHQAIVPEDLFRTVERRLEAAIPSVTPGAVTASPWPLSGLVICGKCGHRYVHDTYGKHKAYASREPGEGHEIRPGREWFVSPPGLAPPAGLHSEPPLFSVTQLHGLFPRRRCAVRRCGRAFYAKNLCKPHYKQFQRGTLKLEGPAWDRILAEEAEAV